MGNNTADNQLQAGIKLILSAVSADEALTELLKAEAAWLKDTVKNITIDELSKLNIMLRNTITAMVLTSDKIEAGVELIKSGKLKQINEQEQTGQSW
jgi:hypothetical protein